MFDVTFVKKSPVQATPTVWRVDCLDCKYSLPNKLYPHMGEIGARAKATAHALRTRHVTVSYKTGETDATKKVASFPPNGGSNTNDDPPF